MTNVDFRLNPRPPRLLKLVITPAFLLTSGCVILFPVGALDAVLTTHESGYADNPGIEFAMVITALGLAALISFAVILRGDFRLAEDRETRRFVACIGLAMLCCALLLAAYSAGTWVPYSLHLDGLTVHDRVEGSELEVRGIVLLQAFLAGAASIFVGCVAGFLAWCYQQAPKLGEIADRLPWPWRFGVGVPLLLGLVLASAVAISWVTGSEYEPPEELEAGSADEYEVAAPRLFEEDDVWVVRLLEGGFLALYDRGLERGCPLQWRREFDFTDRSGWFVDACTGSAYDVTGRCFSDACRGRPLDRYSAMIDGDNVIVDLRVLHRDLPVDANADPVNPPQD